MLQSPSSFDGKGKWSVQRTFHQFSQLGCAQVLPLKRRTGKNVGTPLLICSAKPILLFFIWLFGATTNKKDLAFTALV
jgi:hypothetical protein